MFSELVSKRRQSDFSTDQIKVNVVSLEVSKGDIQLSLDILRLVVCIPQLSSNLKLGISKMTPRENRRSCIKLHYKNLAPGYARSLDAVADLFLVAVNRSRVDVAISGSPGPLRRHFSPHLAPIACFRFSYFAHHQQLFDAIVETNPSTEADSGDGIARIKLEALRE